MFRMAVICKVVLNDDMRRFELAYPLSLSALLESIVAKFGLERSVKLRLVWIDSDGDHITVCSDAALVEAFSTTSGAPLRLQLVPAPTPLLASATTAPSTTSTATEAHKEEIAREVRLQRAQLKLAHLRAFRARLEAREQAMKERTTAVEGQMAHERARLDEREKRLLGKFPELATMAPVEPAALGDLRKRMMFGAAACGGENRGPRGMFGKFRGGCPRFFNPEGEGALPVSNVVCDDCEAPITRSDVRFKCGDCDNFDLCASCEPKTTHDATHVLLKLRPEAQEERPFLPVHRPMLRPKWGGKHGHGHHGKHGHPGFPQDGPHGFPHHGGPRGFPHHGPFGGRFGHWRRAQHAAEAAAEAAVEAAATATEQVDAINQLFTQLLPEIQAKLAAAGLTELNIKQLFDQLLQTVKATSPALVEQLTQIAQDLLANATDITVETVMPRLEQLVQNAPDLLAPGALDQLVAGVLPAIGACLSQVRLVGLDVSSIFAGACPFVAQPAPPAPAPAEPATPEHEAADFSPLAALSIPPEILEQLTQIAANPQEALSLWEAMQQ